MIKEQIDKANDSLREIRKNLLLLDTLRIMNLKGKDRLIHDIEEEENRLRTAQRVVEWLENTPEKEISPSQRNELPIAKNTVSSSIENLQHLNQELKKMLQEEAFEQKGDL